MYSNKKLTQLFATGETGEHLDEILYLAGEICADVDKDFLATTHKDLKRFFTGTYPGYLPSDTPYHNLTHTYGVVLATVRLFHGHMCEGKVFNATILKQGIVSAYFHDTGMIRKNTETENSGAKYIKGHENRSIALLSEYLASENPSESFLEGCIAIIRCTNLDMDPVVIDFPSDEIKFSAFIVGSADILAQMSDRDYLERLPLLYQERKDGGISSHSSAAQLMEETADFYQHVVAGRLEKNYENVGRAMKTHFYERWQLDKDLYSDNIQKNIHYLNTVLKSCQSKLDCLEDHLRRGTIIWPEAE